MIKSQTKRFFFYSCFFGGITIWNVVKIFLFSYSFPVSTYVLLSAAEGQRTRNYLLYYLFTYFYECLVLSFSTGLCMSFVYLSFSFIYLSLPSIYLSFSFVYLSFLCLSVYLSLSFVYLSFFVNVSHL